MKKKFALIISAVILTAALVCVFGGIRYGWFHRASAQDKMFMEEFQKYNTDIMFCGNIKPCKEIKFEHRFIDEITPETIDNGKDNYYHAVILMDRDGKLDLSDEELILLREYCETKYYDMFYYGTEHQEQLKRCGYINLIDRTNMSIWYNGYCYRETGVPQNTEDVIHSNPFLVRCSWDKEDEEETKYSTYHLWKNILFSLCDSMEH